MVGDAAARTFASIPGIVPMTPMGSEQRLSEQDVAFTHNATLPVPIKSRFYFIKNKLAIYRMIKY